MKKLLILFISFFSLFSLGFLNQVDASIFGGSNTKIPYCESGDDCSLEDGVKYAGGIKTVVTQGLASEYIQKIVVHVLTFLKLLAILIIIYSGFNMLTSAGDEEKAKKSKTIIVFAIIGLLIIFLAGPITNFIIDLLSGNP